MDQTPINLAQPIKLAHEQAFRIGAAEIRPATREVVCDTVVGIVEPRVMQMLVALHRADGGVVSKDDLTRLCWEGRVVGEDAINRVVSRLRHDAAEKAGGAFKIETITRVGYRLIETDRPIGTKLLSRPIDRRRALAAGAAIAAVGGTAVGWRLLDDRQMPPEARRLYEQGWAALREGTVDQYASAIAKLRLAADLAPNHAEPWGALALAYQKQAQFAPSGQLEALRARGAAAARRALAIDPDNGDAIAASVLPVPLFRNWVANERACRSAIARAPRHPGTNSALASLLAAVGRFRECLQYVDRALDAEPMAPRFHMFRASILWDIGRLEEAEAVFERAFRLWPRHYFIWFSRYYFLAHNGRAQEALAMIADTANRPTGIPDWNFEATELQAKALANPNGATVGAATSAALAMAKRGVGFAEGAILFAASMNQVDMAYSVMDAYYFDQGFTLGEARFSKEQAMYSARRERHTYFLFIPRLAAVRRDPRFAPMIEELGFNTYWRASGSTPDYRSSR